MYRLHYKGIYPAEKKFRVLEYFDLIFFDLYIQNIFFSTVGLNLNLLRISRSGSEIFLFF